MNHVQYDFSGNRYIVTGASSGMGRQVALDLADAGAVVLALGRNEERLSHLKKRNPDRIVTASVDVLDETKVENVISDFVSGYGKINGAVCAAGIVALTPLRAFDEKKARQIMDTNFWGSINVIQLAIKAKFAEKASSYVLFSSVDANGNAKGQFAYSASKAAINAAVTSLAKELASKNHRLNSVMPGWVHTAMEIPFMSEEDKNKNKNKELLGVGEPEDVSKAVLFLLSDGASWITGTNLVVDGGYLA